MIADGTAPAVPLLVTVTVSGDGVPTVACGKAPEEKVRGPGVPGAVALPVNVTLLLGLTPLG